MRNKTLRILQDVYCYANGNLTPVLLKAGTVLTWNRIVNNGTPLLSYECNHEGKTLYVKPTIGFVVAD